MSEFIWHSIGSWQGGMVHSVALTAHATTGQAALAASDAGLFRSRDGGRTWARGCDLGYTALRVVVCAPDDANVALAAAKDGSLFRSSDSGETWQRMASWSFGVINALALSPNYTQDGALFAATQDGIFRSRDGGSAWQNASFGLLDADMLCLACAPDFATSEVVWAGSAAGGLFRSRNAGLAWRESGVGLADAAVQSIALGAGATALFAGMESGGVFGSSNGAAWQARGLDSQQVNCLATHNGHIVAGTGEGLFLSEDDGLSWRRTMPDDAVLALTAAPNGIILAGCLTAGIMASDDGGRTWQRATTGIAAHVPPLAVQSPDGALFVFDVAGSAAHSPDGGVTWDDIQLQDEAIQCAVAGGSAQQPRLFAATANHVFRWHAEAAAFVPLSAQPVLGDDDAICSLTITADGSLLLGTVTGTVAISVNGGRSWHSVAAPGTGTIGAVRLTTTGSLLVLRLAPEGGGVFNAEAWLLPVLVLPAMPAADDWRMVAALDALRVPLACMMIEGSDDDARVVLAGQNVVAVATVAGDQTRTSILPDEITITALVAAHKHMFAATNRGMYVLEHDDLTWRSMAGDVADAPVVALFADTLGVIAITLGGEIWRCDAAADLLA